MSKIFKRIGIFILTFIVIIICQAIYWFLIFALNNILPVDNYSFIIDLLLLIFPVTLFLLYKNLFVKFYKHKIYLNIDIIISLIILAVIAFFSLNFSPYSDGWIVICFGLLFLQIKYGALYLLADLILWGIKILIEKRQEKKWINEIQKK